MPSALYSLPKKEFPKFFAFLLKNFTVIAPVEREGASFFDEVRSPDEVFFPHSNTEYSPKNYFFPHQEDLLEYCAKDAKKAAARIPRVKKTVLFGIRPCDFHAIRVNDLVMSSGGARDPYYFARRENTLLAVIACSKPGPHCFCDSMGYGEIRESDGFDLLLFKKNAGGEDFFVQPGSPAGKKIVELARLKKTRERARPRKIVCRKRVLKRALAALDKQFEKKFGAREWASVAETCLCCGACTAVCPTCNCFDVSDEFDGARIVRRRKETSCFFPSFTRIAGGRYLRSSRAARLKQFAFHKMVYFPREFGCMMCVGCGRCFTTCLKKIDVFEVTNKIGGGNGK